MRLVPGASRTIRAAPLGSGSHGARATGRTTLELEWPISKARTRTGHPSDGREAGHPQDAGAHPGKWGEESGQVRTRDRARPEARVDESTLAGTSTSLRCPSRRADAGERGDPNTLGRARAGKPRRDPGDRGRGQGAQGDNAGTTQARVRRLCGRGRSGRAQPLGSRGADRASPVRCGDAPRHGRVSACGVDPDRRSAGEDTLALWAYQARGCGGRERPLPDAPQALCPRRPVSSSELGHGRARARGIFAKRTRRLGG